MPLHIEKLPVLACLLHASLLEHVNTAILVKWAINQITLTKLEPCKRVTLAVFWEFVLLRLTNSLFSASVQCVAA